MNLDPALLKDAVIVGTFYIEGGVRSFAEFSAKMIEEFGAGVQKYLRPAYDEIRKRTDIDTTGMDELSPASQPPATPVVKAETVGVNEPNNENIMVTEAEAAKARKDWESVKYTPPTERNQRIKAMANASLILGEYHARNGAQTMAAFSAAMRQEFGSDIEEHLGKLYVIAMTKAGLLAEAENTPEIERLFEIAALEVELEELRAKRETQLEQERMQTAQNTQQEKLNETGSRSANKIPYMWMLQLAALATILWIALVRGYSSPSGKTEIWHMWYQSPELFWTSIAWAVSAAIAIVDTRVEQAKRMLEQNALISFIGIPTAFAMTFHIFEWLFFIGTLILEWKVGLMVCGVIFLMKLLGPLEVAGNLLLRCIGFNPWGAKRS